MCRWVAYLGEPIFLEEFVTTPRQSLIVQSRHSREGKNAVNGDGCGLGWYGDREQPGLFRDVRPAWSDENLLSLAHQIKSRLFFAHVRASTGTATTRANCHPFSYGNWMFMHNGKIGGWDRVRRPIEAAIPTNCSGIARAPPTARSYFFCCWPTASKKTRQRRAQRPCGLSGTSCAAPVKPIP